MKSHKNMLVGLLITLSCCNAQQPNTPINIDPINAAIVKGDTVKALGNSIMVIYQDKKNNYWFGSWETGLHKYDGKTLINYTTKHGLPSNRVDEIQEDQYGNIYLNFISPKSTIIKYNGTSFTPLLSRATNDWKLQLNDLWFEHGYYAEKVYRYDGSTLHELQLPKPPTLSNPFEIYSIYKDVKGNIWFGTNPSGVCRYNGKTIDWITEEDVTEFRKEGANGVRSIIEDDKGDFWFNTEQTYRVYHNDTAKQKKFYKRQKSIGSLKGKNTKVLREFLSITKDNNNNLWMATYLDGVWKYDGKKTTNYLITENAKDITTFYIYKDNLGNIWVGTPKNGAYKFNKATFEKFTL